MAVRVLIPSPLRSYTGDAAWVTADGATIGEVLADLDRRFPGIRFRMIDEQERMRAHVRFFDDERQTFDLARPLRDGGELLIVQALSGG
jgi:molybdopterin converting factor small subunit